MNINTKYKSTDDVKYDKEYIIIGNTKFGTIEDYEYSLTCSRPILPNYSIDEKGGIFQFSDSRTKQNYLTDLNFNKRGIIITLENSGYLNKTNKNVLVDWRNKEYYGDIYNKLWQDKYSIWAKYTEKQYESLIYLTNKLINECNINRNVAKNNIVKSSTVKEGGVLYISNIIPTRLDLSPAFDYEYFKEQITKNEEN